MDANPRLFSVFSICQELGIDDPIHWMNNTSRIVIDWWVGFMSLKNEREREAYSDTSSGNKMSPEDASEYLSSVVGVKKNAS